MGKGWFYGKGRNGGEKKRGGNKWEKIKMFLVATNVVASRPPERRPTAMPLACANTQNSISEVFPSQFYQDTVT